MLTLSNNKKIPENKWPASLVHEIACLRRWPAVVDGTIMAETSTDSLIIRFSIQTEQLVEPQDTPIRDVEPFLFFYQGLDQVGVEAPAVWSGRDDFPKDIGHINPSSPDMPASICLARAGLQPIYDHYGINGVIQRLIDWLHDAKTGQLMKDGWEPTPIPEGQNFGLAYYNLACFQEIAAESPEGAWACGEARVLSLEGSRENEVLYHIEPDIFQNNQGRTQTRRRLITSEQRYIPWVFVWPDEATATGTPIFGQWNTLGDIIRDVGAIGLSEPIAAAIIQTFTAFGNDADINGLGGRSYILLVGVWRPLALADHIYGLSSVPLAKKLEIKVFVLSRDGLSQHIPIADDISVRQLLSLSFPEREILQFTSGTITPPAAMIGYGALGSTISDFLLRSGVPTISVMDKDIFDSHNIARHTGLVDDVGRPKIHAFEALAKKIASPIPIEQHAIKQDVLLLDNDGIANFCSRASILIDATADERVRKHLTTLSIPEQVRLVRIEIFNRGRLGILFLTGASNNPNLVDLYYQLCFVSLENNDVAAWLKSDGHEGAMEELIIGIGCASATVRMPKHVVTQHASAFMPSLLSDFDEIGGIGINPLNPEGQPAGWAWLDVKPVTILNPQNAKGWSIRLSEHAHKKLDRLRVANGDNEVGGYLYGGFDYGLKQIYVVEASNLPPGSSQAVSYLDLGPAGRTQDEIRLKRKAGGKLALVGTWHSHPRSEPKMSIKDKKTMAKFLPEDRQNGVPTLLVITALRGIQAYLWV